MIDLPQWDSWEPAYESWLRDIRRRYRKLKADVEEALEMHLYMREKFGPASTKALSPQTRAALAAHEEGHPELRAMRNFIRGVEAVKRELRGVSSSTAAAIPRLFW